MEEIIIGPIDPKLRVQELRSLQKPDAEKPAGGFGEILKDAISTVNELQKESSHEIQKLMTGESRDLHSTVIAMQKADLSFQMMMQVRNKIVQAYQEIMRMQV
ncbi:MAG TPA: flagellar hook-basal body complex protein FliE [Acidobacteriota bacterium]|nr:flagellar hook-basal body complex protein FliE [Acidobacteriota bacterium]